MTMMTVRDVMTRSVISVRPVTPMREVARLLSSHGISGLPVVDDAGVIVGVVSEADLLVKEQGRDALPHRPLARLIGDSPETRTLVAKLEATTAGGAMTSPPITITPGRTIADAAAMMTARHINRLPVIEEGRLVGIVTRADLVRAYVRTDEELVEAIREDVLRHILWLDPNAFDVRVVDGMARIGGQVDRRSTAEMLPRVVGMIPGIAGVVADLGWDLDDSKVGPPTRDPVFPFSPR